MITNGRASDYTDDDGYNWKDDAVCGEIAPDMWFPKKGESAKEAKRICWEVCTVREECLEYALADTTIQVGIWGGMTPRQLREIRKERGLQDQLDLLDEEESFIGDD